MVSGCNRELSAYFYSAASLKYHVPDTWHDTNPNHIILTLGRTVIALPSKSECHSRSILMTLLVAAHDPTRDLPFTGGDTLPTELPGPVISFCFSKHENNRQILNKIKTVAGQHSSPDLHFAKKEKYLHA